LKALCVLGQHNYGQASRGLGYEHVNFLPALRQLGYEPVLFESLDRSRYRDFAQLNRALLDAVEREAPDLIFSVLLNYEIWSETLDLVGARSAAPLLNWGTDDSWKYEQFSRYLAPHVDLWATTSTGAAEKAHRDGHQNFVLTQWAASAQRLTVPLPAADCRYDVTFVGSAYGNRVHWIEQLRRRGVPVECFGQGWPAGPVSAEDVARIYRESRITLNFGDSGMHLRGVVPYRSRQIKARVFEVPGAGGLLLTEHADGLEAFYRPGEEVLVFQGADELADMVRRLLARPAERDAIAVAAHERTRREHTYEQRFSALIPAAHARRRMRGAPSSGDEFAALARTHRAGAAARLLRGCLVPPARWLFGPVRGPRAVRRLVYEASWRLAGARTYSARGLPGRLFYAES
jgi:spore maturation protein CgeB